MVYFVLLIMFLILYIATFNYKKDIRQEIKKRKYKSWMFWGIGMFITDRFPKTVMKASRWDKKIRELTVKEDIVREKYFYIVEKITLSIMIIVFTLFIATIVSVNESQQNSEIREIKRGDTIYQIEVQYEGGNKENINLEIPEKELTDEEKRQYIEEAKGRLYSTILGDNKDLNEVYYDLNLVSTMDENKIGVVWDISNEEIIDYEGHIGNNIPSQGVEILLKATLMLDDITSQVEFSAKVFPSRKQKGAQEYLQEYVENYELNQEKVILPEEINGEKVKYYTPIDNYAPIIGVVGILIGIAVFFLKDKDLDKEIDARDKQLVRDYPEIVSKILLFYGAGLSLKSTFEEIVKEYRSQNKGERYAYEEMELSLNKMKTGISEEMAINEYGNRCGVNCYIKLANIIEQNLKRGTKEITYALKNELNYAMNERKNNALKIGSEISTKLLGPMLLMLGVAMAIVMVPAFMSMNL